MWDTVFSPHRLSLGLRRLAPGELWLDLVEDLPSDLAEKDRLLREQRQEVLVELPGSRESQSEALDRILEFLLEEFPDYYALDRDRLQVKATGETLHLSDPTRAPIETAARCVQEDLVVMAPSPDGWRLTAAAVCFPTRWALRPQLGRSMTDIHQRVPGYAESLDATSNRFFDAMKPGDVFARGNWSLLDDPALHQPTGKMRCERNFGIDAGNAGDKVWLRVEHQTLQRLPRSDAILFGIRIHRTKLREIGEDIEASRTLVEAIATMSPAMQRYKSLETVRDATVDYLNTILSERA